MKPKMMRYKTDAIRPQQMMKFICIISFLFYSRTTQAQNSLQLIDISQMQIRLMQQGKNLDSLSRSKIFIDSVYTPYREFWNGYMGDADAVAIWMNEAGANIPQFLKKNHAIDGLKLSDQLTQIAGYMATLTGYQPAGTWYIIYGPAWTDLGGIGDFAMLIDLSHESNSSNERIIKMFPHELTHQIMTHVNKHKDSTAISSIIGEGVAVWMNQKYWKERYTLAENLGYTDTELQVCDKNIDVLKAFFLKNKYATDPEVIDIFRNRNAKLNKQLPGAIGYYFGYRIIETYVKKFGKDSWKDVFTKSPKEIYELSGFAG